MAGSKKKSTPVSVGCSVPPGELSEPDQKVSRKSGRKIYKADYGDATPEEVAKAILTYRR